MKQYDARYGRKWALEEAPVSVTELAERDKPSQLVTISKRHTESRMEMEDIMKKTVVTVVGKDSVGIIAKVCTYLANNTINILDISQTIVRGFFNMMMIVDLEVLRQRIW